MRQADLKLMTLDQLIDRFAEIGIAQDHALLYDEYKEFRRLFSQINDVDSELRRRGLSASLALLRLFDHSNMQVRLKAAKRSLGSRRRQPDRSSNPSANQIFSRKPARRV
jgi:hypothetical protein